MGFDPFSAVADLAKDCVDRIFPDPADKLKAEALKADLEKTILTQGAQIIDAQSKIIIAEAQSDSYLAKNWRPITMLCFVGLVICHWFGLNASGISEAQYLSLFDLIKIGLGGYVVGRSLEKVADSVGDSFGTKKPSDSNS